MCASVAAITRYSLATSMVSVRIKARYARNFSVTKLTGMSRMSSSCCWMRCSKRSSGPCCPRDGTPLQTSKNAPPPIEVDPYLGVELAGQIQLKHLIGIGSMGRVYRAWQGGIERDVAVKILHRELSGNAELVKRFHR